MDYDYVFKLILIGNHSVGKSSFINALSSGVFISEYMPTIGVDFKVIHTKMTDGMQIKCHVWDTAGQEQYQAITRSYFKCSAGAIVMYDTSEISSFLSVKKWLDIIDAECSVPSLPKILVASKSDKKDQVDDNDAKLLAEKYDMPFIKISSLYMSNISGVIPSLCNEIIEKSLKKNILNGIRAYNNEQLDIRTSNEYKKNPNRCCIIS